MISKIKKSGVVYPIKDDRIPELPADASEKTYILKVIDGVFTWVEESVEPTSYTISDYIENGSLSGDETIEADGTATVVIVPNEGYSAPETESLRVIVFNASIISYAYDQNTKEGNLLIGNPTGDVSIYCTCNEEIEFYNITASVTNGEYQGGAQIPESETQQLIRIVPNSGYVAPSIITQSNVVGATYNNDYEIVDGVGVFTIGNPISDVTITCVCEAEQPQPTGLTPFTTSDSILTGDKICFDTSISDADMLAFCQGLTYDDGICTLVANQDESAAEVVVYNMDGAYALVAMAGAGMAGWASVAIPDAGLSQGWNGLDQDGKAEMQSDFGAVGYVNPAQGWNGVIVGFEKAE